MSDSESTSSGVSSFHSGRGPRRRWRPSWQATPPPPRVDRLLAETPVDREAQVKIQLECMSEFVGAEVGYCHASASKNETL